MSKKRAQPPPFRHGEDVTTLQKKYKALEARFQQLQSSQGGGADEATVQRKVASAVREHQHEMQRAVSAERSALRSLVNKTKMRAVELNGLATRLSALANSMADGANRLEARSVSVLQKPGVPERQAPAPRPPRDKQLEG